MTVGVIVWLSRLALCFVPRSKNRKTVWRLQIVHAVKLCNILFLTLPSLLFLVAGRQPDIDKYQTCWTFMIQGHHKLEGYLDKSSFVATKLQMEPGIPGQWAQNRLSSVQCVVSFTCVEDPQATPQWVPSSWKGSRLYRLWKTPPGHTWQAFFPTWTSSSLILPSNGLMWERASFDFSRQSSCITLLLNCFLTLRFIVSVWQLLGY